MCSCRILFPPSQTVSFTINISLNTSDNILFPYSFLPSVTVMSIHGKLKTTRFKIFDKFRSLKTTGLLVCTDVMARGIDIADIDWVFQFDAPSSASDFVHRCGRTARIGNRGTALALLLPNEEPYVHFIDINQKGITLYTEAVNGWQSWLPSINFSFYRTDLLLLEKGSNLDDPRHNFDVPIYTYMFILGKVDPHGVARRST